MLTCPSRSIGVYATRGAASGGIPSNCTTDRALASSSNYACSEPRYSRQCCTAASRGAQRACHYDTLRRVHHSLLTRCIGWRKNDRAGHSIPHLDTLIKTGSKGIEVTLRRRRILYAEFLTRMEDSRLPKCVMFGELVWGCGLRDIMVYSTHCMYVCIDTDTDTDVLDILILMI